MLSSSSVGVLRTALSTGRLPTPGMRTGVRMVTSVLSPEEMSAELRASALLVFLSYKPFDLYMFVRN